MRLPEGRSQGIMSDIPFEVDLANPDAAEKSREDREKKGKGKEGAEGKA